MSWVARVTAPIDSIPGCRPEKCFSIHGHATAESGVSCTIEGFWRPHACRRGQPPGIRLHLESTGGRLDSMNPLARGSDKSDRLLGGEMVEIAKTSRSSACDSGGR